MNIKSPLSILIGYVEMASNAMGQWLWTVFYLKVL